jgi:hypothetical protein
MVLVECLRKDEANAARYLRECISQAQFLKTARYSLMAVGAGIVFCTAFGSAEQAAPWADDARSTRTHRKARYFRA